MELSSPCFDAQPKPLTTLDGLVNQRMLMVDRQISKTMANFDFIIYQANVQDESFCKRLRLKKWALSK
jgi:hypothetical protein